MTYVFDQITDGRWYLFWNGEFLGCHKNWAAASIAMHVHVKRADDAGLLWPTSS